MPDWVSVILLAIIEGLTEFIPVSSTGHLLLAQRWLGQRTDLFNVVIQCGAVLAVLPLFPARCRQLFFQWREPAGCDYLLKLSLAFGITCVGGVVLRSMELPEEAAPVGLALLAGGIFFIVIERCLRGRPGSEQITWAVAVAVGIGQLIAAIFPGASRSGTTILIALLLGLSRSAATEFSFLVGVPTLLAAGGFKIVKALQSGAPTEAWGMVLLGTVAAAAVSFVAVKWFLRYVQSHSFEGFGWYRIVLGILVLAFAP